MLAVVYTQITCNMYDAVKNDQVRPVEVARCMPAVFNSPPPSSLHHKNTPHLPRPQTTTVPSSSNNNHTIVLVCLHHDVWVI